MLKRLSLKYRMIAGGILAVIIPFSVASLLIYTQLSKSLIEMTQEKSVIIAQNISQILDATLMQELRLASAIAANPVVIDATETGSYQKAQKLLEATHRRIGEEYFTIFLTDKKGISRADALFDPEKSIDLSDRDYFLKAEKGEASISGPLVSRGPKETGSLIIVIAAPIQKESEFSGIIGIPFNLNYFEGLLSEKRIGQTGIAYLISTDGLVLIHPQKEFNLNLKLLNMPGTDEIENLLKGKKSGSARYIFDGRERIAGLYIMEQADWAVVFSQDKNEIMAPVNSILSVIILIGIIFLIFTNTIIVFYFSGISTPVQKMFEVMRQITEHSSEMILQIGVDKIITYANPAVEKITGLKAADITGKKNELYPAGNITSEKIWDLLESGTFWTGRTLFKKSDSETLTIDVILVPMKNSSGGVEGYLEIGRDVTGEIIFEKRLQHSQKMEAVGTLAGGIAHDFNNILGGIIGYAELSLIDIKNTEKTEQYINEIIRGSERARDLVSQILTFSRQKEVELKPILPEYIIKEALKLLRASIPATISIRSDFSSNSAIMAEPTQLHQVIMNMFTNSVHAIGENSGSIELELKDFIVDEDFVKSHPDISTGKHIIIRISDTGKGMKQDILEHIFDPFFTTKPVGEGTGLGLSVVHGIVKELNGIITAYSESGKGSVFNIIIPSIKTDDSEELHYNSEIKRGSGKIAVIDDEKAITETMQSILKNIGYEVTGFTDSKEALGALLSEQMNYDLIITDYAMPEISGLQIALEIRKKGISTPVILTSGYFDDNLEKASQEAGIYSILTKPVNSYQLSDAVYSAVQNGNRPK